MNIKPFIRRWGLFSLGIALMLPITTVYAKTVWDDSRKQMESNPTVASSTTLPFTDAETKMKATIANATPKKVQPKAQKKVAKKQRAVERSETSKKITVNQSDLDLLARAVYSEARGEHFQGQVAIASVIINRSESNRFPGSIRGVIFQKNAFTAVADGQFWLKPDAEAYRAAKLALNGSDPTNGALFYCNPTITTSKWMKEKIANSSTKRIGKHVFMK